MCYIPPMGCCNRWQVFEPDMYTYKDVLFVLWVIVLPFAVWLFWISTSDRDKWKLKR